MSRNPIIKALVTAIAIIPLLVGANSHPPYNGPKSIGEFRQHYPYHKPPHNLRPKVYIRESRNETDDISAEFYNGLEKANNGGTLVLPKGKTFVIGKKLDLTFLNNVEVQLEGEILVGLQLFSQYYKLMPCKFTNNITYWQNNYFYHPFQASITFWKWGGNDIKIFGNGTLNGNGQAWYDGFAGGEILVSILLNKHAQVLT